METPDFVTLYFPSIDELSETDIQNARRRLEIFIKQFDPDVDTRPNTPFGDLHLNNLARLLAATEIAHGRFMSDLDLEQVAAGVIYNCDFVTKYLKNFAVVDQDTLQSSGVVRLTFCKDEAYTLDRRARYQFDDNIFNLRLPHPGPLEILPVGSTPPTNTNARVLTQVDENLYSVDVGVVGVMTSPVAAGDDGATDYLLDDMSGISALYDFEYGLPPSSLPTLAAKARETHYTASLTTPGGTRNYLNRQFPDLKAVSPIITGDTEMIRDIVNPLGVGAGYLDTMIQSSGYAGVDAHYVELEYFSTQGADSVDKFIGLLDLVNAPQQIVSITSAQDPTVELGLNTESVDIISESLDKVNTPLAQASYTVNEKLWISIAMPRTDAGVAKLTNDIDISTGKETHRFLVTYKADPMLSVVNDDVMSRSVKPVGVNVLVRGLIPVVIEDLLITYVRNPGVNMKLDTARDEVYNYFRSLGYPNLYTDSKIIDAMYYAGATDVISVNCTAQVQWSVANYFLKTPGENSPIDSLSTTLANCVQATDIKIASSKGLIPLYQDENLGTNDQTYVSIGPRSVGYILDKANIRFSEIIR